MSIPSYSRRGFLLGLGTFSAWSMLPRLSAMAGTPDPRFLVVILRGAMDGLSAVPPIGDPDYERTRKELAIPGSGEGAALPLDGFFGLNPKMPNLHRLYRNGQAILVHAVTTSYRGRSHFDGQDVLESGLNGTGGKDGWLNRALSLIPHAGRANPREGLSIGITAPLIMTGPAPITSWAPQTLPMANAQLALRLQNLYLARDPALARALQVGVKLDDMLAADNADNAGKAERRPYAYFISQTEAAARLMSLPDGPRIAAASFDGWDTHRGQSTLTEQLSAALDDGIAALERGLASVWQETVIVLITEFGRTVHVNTAIGTDHGTGTVAMIVGGAVKGGRIISDWPGLSSRGLLDGRDLKPTADLRGILKGVLVEHLGLPAATLNKTVFPDASNVSIVGDLVRSA